MDDRVIELPLDRLFGNTRPKPDAEIVDQYAGELWCAHATAVAS